MNLTPTQAFLVERATQALQASEAETDTSEYCRHLGVLEQTTAGLLKVIADLTEA